MPEDYLKKAIEEARQKRQRREKVEQKASAEGRKVSGRPPKIDKRPEPKAQRNFTDPESGIMKGADGYIQGYNCQAAVDAEAQVIVACDASANPADKVHLEKMIEQIEQNIQELPDRLSADGGYFSEANVSALQQRGIDPYIAVRRERAEANATGPPRGRIPKDATVKDRMKRKLRTKKGKDVYRMRKAIAKPVFGQVKNRGHRQFRLRGLRKVRGEWSLICTSHNLLKLHRALGGHWNLN